jgi:PAS domain S-box-containing protein
MVKRLTMTIKSRQLLIEAFQQITEGVEGYTLILLDRDGTILTWNKGVEKLKGYSGEEIIGQNMNMFYVPEDRQANLPQRLLQEASSYGRAINIGKRIRKNGTVFLGSIEISAIKDKSGEVIGFTNLAREVKDIAEVGHFWFDNDGVLHVEANEATHTPEGIMRFRKLLESASHAGKFCCIADIRRSITNPKSLRSSKQELLNKYKAVAYISDSRIDPITETIASLIEPEIPVKVFTTRSDAKEWIKQFLS